MRFLRGLVFLLGRLLHAFLFGWATGWRELWRRIKAWWEAWRDEHSVPERERRKTDRRCVPIRHPAMQQPDPLIYSQEYLMGLGLAVTWDNPDIQLFKGATPVDSSSLEPATDYRLDATIWNSSPSAPVVGLPVRFTLHGFGIGTTPVDLGTKKVDLGVKGGPNHPATASIDWQTPPTAGHYCIKAHIEWADDSNPNNNVGQENTNVVATSSPARTAFLLRNDDRERRHRYRFEVDTYEIPNPTECDDMPHRREDARPARYGRTDRPLPDDDTRERHDRASHPVPVGWTVEIAPDDPVLSPLEELEIAVTITPPDGFTGSKAFNIDGFHDEGFAGGVTFLVTSG